MLLDIGLFIVTLGLIIYLWLTWHHDYWEKNGVKYLNPSIIFGNLKDVILARTSNALAYDKLYWSYPDEPAIGIYRLRQPELLIRDHDLVKTVLIKEFDKFHDNPFYVGNNVDPIVRNNPFVATGERWKVLRGIHTPALTTMKLKSMLPLMQKVCRDMIEYLKQNEDIPLEAKYFSGQYTTDVVASCVYGLSSNSFNDPNSKFRKMTSKVFQPSLRTTLAFTSFHFLPILQRFMKLSIIPDDVAKFLKAVIAETCEYRKKNGIKFNDFLQQLLNENEKHEKDVYSYEDIVSFTMTFFFDGYETSSIAISYVLYQLALHDDVQEKLRNEIINAFPSMEKIDFDVLQNLPYLDAVVSETLRLYPPGVVMNKLCTKKIVLRSEGKEYPIKPGITVSLPLFSFHRDPKYFEDPESFRPDRFYQKTQSTDGYFPFGMGPRACLGSRFALTQLKVAIISLLLNFSILPKESNPRKLEFDSKSSILLVPVGGIWIKFKSLAL